MLKNYLKVALRSLQRSRAHALINIAGLSVGIACCVLILLYVRNELSYDRHYPDADKIYRVEIANWAASPMAVGPYLHQTFPDVAEAARFQKVNRAFVGTYQETLTEKRFFFADSSAFRVFGFPLIEGNAATALSSPNSVVLTRDMATKYFGDQDPLGKNLKVEAGRSFLLTVTGVVENNPSQTHLKFDFLASYGTLQVAQANERLQWAQSTVYTYVRMNPNSPFSLIERTLGKVLLQRTGEPDTSSIDVLLRPVTEIHLYSKCEKEIEPVGNINYVYILSSIALCILLLAVINFINLSTARSLRRAREVAMRKALGADKAQLILQFIGESCIVSFVATLIAIGLVELLIPSFNSLSGVHVSLFGSGMVMTLQLILFLSLLVGVIAGSYPAFYLSRFQPVKILKAGYRLSSVDSGAGFLRKALVVFQFAISIALIVGSILIERQLNFVQNKDIGMDKEQVLIMPIGSISGERYSALKSELLQNSNVTGVAASFSVPGERVVVEEFRPESAVEKVYYIRLILSDVGFPQTYGLAVRDGRSFSEQFGTDTAGAFLINEKAAALFGWKSSVGKRIEFPSQKRGGEVVGVVRDFNFASLHSEVEPLVIHVDQNPAFYKYISIRIGKGDKRAAVQTIDRTWKAIQPGRPFEYYFLDESFGNLYLAEARLRTIVAVFTIIGILIASLGLLGLVSQTVEQRTKEIGIRKVLGSSVSGILGLISREFLPLILISNIAAWPIAYYIMRQWLEAFAYRIEIGIGVFFLAAGLALVIAFLSLSIQAIRAAMANPVEALRYE